MRAFDGIEVTDMSAKLYQKGYDHARTLVEQGSVVRDQRDDWSEHKPSAEDENELIRREGLDEYARWHLGIDQHESAETKARYKFPYGDFKKVHRCAVISAESRAGQYKYLDIEQAAKRLLELIDAAVPNAAR
jgi:hypothetical protein